MKIVFFPVDCAPFHEKTLEMRPLGGTETAIIRLAEALALMDQQVYVISMQPLSASLPGNKKPIYLTSQYAADLKEFDALVVIRGLRGLLKPFKCQKRFFWTGDAYNNAHTYGLGDKRLLKILDGLLAVSSWQAQTLCQASGFPLSKTYVLRNGVHLADFKGEVKRLPKRLIYSSSPLRGLEFLAEIFIALHRIHSEAELAIFSGSSVYRSEWPPINAEEREANLFSQLRSLPGCQVCTPQPQHLLAQEFMKSAIWAYPTNFQETSCITALEAQAGGAVPVTTALAALPEAVEDSGITIFGKAGTKEYTEQYIEACNRLFSDENLWQRYSQKCKERSLDFDWSRRAAGFLNFLKSSFFP